jgi:ATP-dependent DNA helicase DinG|tara:strand:+ start:39 stop:1931 length:1893 start_codon:yes stop_codon:yes gene_type:complete
MAECPICKSTIKATPIGSKTVGIQCNCNGNTERYFINSGTVDDTVSDYIRKFSKNTSPSVIPGKIIGDTPVVRTAPISKIEEYFPSEIIPRDIQKQILKEIETNIKLGFKKIVISAPTGVGKSAIGMAIAKYFGTGFFITKSKSLQDQYTRDFPILKSVKGKSNFECLKLMDEHKVDDPILAKELGHTCEKGVCLEGTEENSEGKSIKTFCTFKPLIKDVTFDTKLNESTCTYYFQKYFGLISNFSVWNYSGFFQLMKNKSVFTDYLEKKVSIFDEAHGIEDQIINFIGIDISNKQLDECKIDLSRYNISDIKELTALLVAMKKFYATQYAEIKGNDGDLKILEYYDENFKKFSDFIGQIESDPKNFLISDNSNDFGNSVTISIKPLLISKYVDDFFNTEYQIFMSATINKKNFCETMGLDEKHVAFIDTPKSPFLYEHRKVDFLDVAFLNSRSSFAEEQNAIRKIDEILSKHKTERGLILTSSKKRCFDILSQLSPENKKRIRICHSSNSDGTTQDEKIAQHRATSGSVLLSSSLWEGVDLKDDDSRFQIIAKAPYKSLGDTRVRAKMNKFPSWYSSETMMKILQGFGRSIRSEDDWARTYVIDSTINNLVKQTRNIVPKAYWDVLQIS